MVEARRLAAAETQLFTKPAAYLLCGAARLSTAEVKLAADIELRLKCCFDKYALIKNQRLLLQSIKKQRKNSRKRSNLSGRWRHRAEGAVVQSVGVPAATSPSLFCLFAVCLL